MLRVNNLNVSLNDNQILKDLSVEFESGTLCCILGKNGGGKSTLIKAIEGIEESTGDIIYNNIDVRNLSIKEKAKIISYLPQTRQIPSISARLMVEHGRFPHLGFSKTLNEHDKEVCKDAIDKVGIKHLLSKNLTEMSGGELQRVCIASTIAQESSVILLDEPTTHLDLVSQLDVINLIKSLKSENTTIVVVLHDLLQAFTFFDKIYLLDDGRIIEEGKPEVLYNSENIKKIFNYGIEKDLSSDSLYKYKLTK